jgi:hypothetical protein
MRSADFQQLHAIGDDEAVGVLVRERDGDFLGALERKFSERGCARFLALRARDRSGKAGGEE